ncbi:MAG: alpha-amylase family glycosyl hydrolase [Kiritimatiellia bacterium]
MKKKLILLIGLLASASGLSAAEKQEELAKPVTEFVKQSVIYQIHPRVFSKEGTLKAVEKRLPQLAELGVDILYVLPIFVSDPDTDRSGWSSSQKASGMNNPRNPYRMKDYYHVDPEYGTDQDLKEFVSRAHKLGMKVMLDMVFYHCGPNAVFLKDHPDFVKRNKDGSIDTGHWNFPVLNHANPELREYLIRNMEYWAEDFSVDGFRADVAGAVPLDFWETARERLEKINPDVIMLAEGFRKNNQLKAFDLDYSFSWYRTLQSVYLKEKPVSAIRDTWKRTNKAALPGARFIHYLESHDTTCKTLDWKRPNKIWGPDLVDTALVLNFSVDGVPWLYNGQEVADTSRHNIHAVKGSMVIDWANGDTPRGKERFELCQKLCRLRHTEKTLTHGDLIWLENSAPDKVISFLRTTDSEQIFVLINMTKQDLTVEVTLPFEKEITFNTLLLRNVTTLKNADNVKTLEIKGCGFYAGKFRKPLNQRHARVSPDWIHDGIMYQIQPRAFVRGSRLNDMAKKIPELAEMGVNILYMCPVFVSDDDPEGWSPRQKKSGTNNPRNPYRMKDYYHVDPEYGTDADLKNFVKAAHRHDMRVMLDMVYLHCGPNAVFLKDHPDFVKRDKDGKIIVHRWGFPAINMDNPELREYLWANMEYWVTDFDVDGFRTDVADAIPLDFWETARKRLQKIRPDIGMLAEGTRPENQLKAYDLCYGWHKNYKKWNDATKIREAWETMFNSRPEGGAKFIRFIDNHDFANDDYDNRVEKRWGFKRVNVALVGLFTLDGVPMIYNGQEVCDKARHSIFGQMPIDWANAGTREGRARRQFCTELCKMRKSRKALRRGDVNWIDNNAPAEVLSFVRSCDDEEILSVSNLSDKEIKLTLKGVDGSFNPLMVEGAEGDAAGGFTLEPYGFFVGEL